MCPHALRFGWGSRANPAPLSGKSGNTCLAGAVLWPSAALNVRSWREDALSAEHPPLPSYPLLSDREIPPTHQFTVLEITVVRGAWGHLDPRPRVLDEELVAGKWLLLAVENFGST